MMTRLQISGSKFLNSNTLVIRKCILATIALACASSQLVFAQEDDIQVYAQSILDNFKSDRTKNVLSEGDQFPAVISDAVMGKQINLRGKPTLLFIRGGKCGTCEEIIKVNSKILKSNGFQIIHALPMNEESLPQSGTVFFTKRSSAVHTALDSGILATIVKRSSAPMTYVLDAKGKVRYFSIGFYRLSEDQKFKTAINNIKQPLSNTSGRPKIGADLQKISWQSKDLKKLVQESTKFKKSVVIVSEESTCAACNNLFTDLRPFLDKMSSKGYGVFYIDSNSTKNTKSKDPRVFIDVKSEWNSRFRNKMLPQIFFLNGSNYAGDAAFFSIDGLQPYAPMQKLIERILQEKQ